MKTTIYLVQQRLVIKDTTTGEERKDPWQTLFAVDNKEQAKKDIRTIASCDVPYGTPESALWEYRVEKTYFYPAIK